MVSKTDVAIMNPVEKIWKRRRLKRSATTPVNAPINAIGKNRNMIIKATCKGDPVMSNTTTPTANISNQRKVLVDAPISQINRNSRFLNNAPKPTEPRSTTFELPSTLTLVLSLLVSLPWSHGTSDQVTALICHSATCHVSV
jgi:hypothetical protein